ncbi:alanine racemase [Acuticoccus mangrovi]|uniref:Alanine racemase n=1 Tax=Acuticoccus mangrovi TaxID=2796142 RepID=A0A934MGJ6_9HYPH|nr:alanine racemase [Acuticoccus mangrovi]MBJ3776653.1 alanine racemase [Acuticoccus mangrovi]
MHPADRALITDLLARFLGGRISSPGFRDGIVAALSGLHRDPSPKLAAALASLSREIDAAPPKPEPAAAHGLEESAPPADADGLRSAAADAFLVLNAHPAGEENWEGVRLTIDPEAVVRNWRRLAALTGAECAAVVKADAYGLGIERVAVPLAAAGCRTFFVALPTEAMRLRRLLPGVVIYVLNGVFDAVREAREAGLRPLISSLEALSEWPQGAFALNVDTGMNRLGVTLAELGTVTRRPALLASHFAAADTPDHPLNVIQEANFAAARAMMSDVAASFANSAALLTRPTSHYDLVRPGIALYGAASAPTSVPLEPTVKLEARVVQVREAAAGETVGYGGAVTLTRPTRIAIASLGYADGYPRAAGSSDTAAGAPVAVAGRRTHLLGRVSMDLLAIDVTGIACARGDFVEIFGPTVGVDEVAARAGTIGYELLTGLSRRATRVTGPL